MKSVHTDRQRLTSMDCPCNSADKHTSLVSIVALQSVVIVLVPVQSELHVERNTVENVVTRSVSHTADHRRGQRGGPSAAMFAVPSSHSCPRTLQRWQHTSAGVSCPCGACTRWRRGSHGHAEQPHCPRRKCASCPPQTIIYKPVARNSRYTTKNRLCHESSGRKRTSACKITPLFMDRQQFQKPNQPPLFRGQESAR